MEKLTLDTHLWNRMRSPTPRNDLNIAPRVTKLKKTRSIDKLSSLLGSPFFS